MYAARRKEDPAVADDECPTFRITFHERTGPVPPPIHAMRFHAVKALGAGARAFDGLDLADPAASRLYAGLQHLAKALVVLDPAWLDDLHPVSRDWLGAAARSAGQ